MNLAICIFAVILLDACSSQTDDPDPEDRKFHKHKHKKRPYQQQYAAPCYDGFGKENNEQDSRSLVAALGGAAVGYHLGTKFPKQPIINNNIYNQYPVGGVGGGAPCFPSSIGSGSIGGGLFGSHQGGLLGSHGSHGGHHGIHGGHHPILSSHLGGGHFGGSHFGGHRQNINWDRTIRQFERNVVRPISKWFK